MPNEPIIKATEHSPIAAKQKHLKGLANIAMPAGLNDLLSGIDNMLINTQHTINASLLHSTQLIEHSRQQLQQFEQLPENTKNTDDTLHYDVPEHNTYEVNNNSAHIASSSVSTKAVLQSTLTEQQNAALESAQTAQHTMDKTIKDMQQQLLAQSKRYEESVTNKVATHLVHSHDAQLTQK